MAAVTVTDFITSGKPNLPVHMGRVEVPLAVNANDVASKAYVDAAVAVLDNTIDGFVTDHEVTETSYTAGTALATAGIVAPATMSVYCNKHDNVVTVTWAASGAITGLAGPDPAPAVMFTLAAIGADYYPAAAVFVAHPHVLTGGATPLTYDNGWVTLGADGVLTFSLSGVNTWVTDTAVLSGSVCFVIPAPVV